MIRGTRLGLLSLVLPACGIVEATATCQRDRDCPSGNLCNLATGHCYSAQVNPDFSVGDSRSTVTGHFRCPYYAKAQTTLPRGTADLRLEYGGKAYTFFAGCGFWPATYGGVPFVVMDLVGSDDKAQEAYSVEVYLRAADYRAGAVKLPTQARGRFLLAKAGAPSRYVAAVWGGTVTFSDTPSAEGQEVTGSAQLTLTPFLDRPYGTICTLFRICDKSCGLKLPELFSPDCRGDATCMYLGDGTDRGFCFDTCTEESDCTSVDSQSTCLLLSTTKVCAHRCTGNADCAAPLVCVKATGCFGG